VATQDFRKGDRYKVIRSFEAGVLTMWLAPFTGGDNKMLPAGLTFVISSEPPRTATAVCADVECPVEWEKLLVPAKERGSCQYAGYYLVVPFEQVITNCARLP
jgi:hypothetical protein